MYQVRRTPRSEFIPVRGIPYHCLIWGEAKAQKTPLVMVHGWMDVAASFQFVVDALGSDTHYVVSPDWRGYGLTQSPSTDNYWHPDYLADLDFLLDHLSPDQPVDLLGHSMGGHIAMLYAGVRPERVRRLINLEGFGMAATKPEQLPKRMGQWIDELKALHRGELDLKPYATVQDVARRLQKTNKRLDEYKALWLAQHWAKPDAQGQWRILGDPAHKIVNAQLFRVEETVETYRAIRAPTLMVEASDNSLATWWNGRYTLDEFHQRLQAVADLRIETVADAGHMMHHDQPQALAGLIEAFVA